MTVDESDLARVLALRHRIGSRHSCNCEDCRAIVRVVAAARENNARGNRVEKKASAVRRPVRSGNDQVAPVDGSPSPSSDPRSPSTA